MAKEISVRERVRGFNEDAEEITNKKGVKIWDGYEGRNSFTMKR